MYMILEAHTRMAVITAVPGFLHMAAAAVVFAPPA